MAGQHMAIWKSTENGSFCGNVHEKNGKTHFSGSSHLEKHIFLGKIH